MAVVTYEGGVEGGQIRLKGDASLPEHAKVYVLVPDATGIPTLRLTSPRLARQDQIVDFALEVHEASSDAGV